MPGKLKYRRKVVFSIDCFPGERADMPGGVAWRGRRGEEGSWRFGERKLEPEARPTTGGNHGRRRGELTGEHLREQLELIFADWRREATERAKHVMGSVGVKNMFEQVVRAIGDGEKVGEGTEGKPAFCL